MRVLSEVSRVVTVGEKTVALTRTEFAILKLLIQNSGQVIAKSVLLDRISMDTPDCTENSFNRIFAIRLTFSSSTDRSLRRWLGMNRLVIYIHGKAEMPKRQSITKLCFRKMM